MSIIKNCPTCNRSYSDLSFEFCLEDGSLLSTYFSENVQFSMMNNSERKVLENDDETTVVKSSENIVKSSKKMSKQINSKRKRELDSWKFERTKRTMDEHPISTSEITSDRPEYMWTASDYIRKITYQLTGKHTFHATGCYEL